MRHGYHSSGALLFSFCTSFFVSSASNGNHIDDVKARILNELGFVDPTVYDRYDIVWPERTIPARSKRAQFSTFKGEDLLYLSMVLFGKQLSVFLEPKNLTSFSFETILMSPLGVPYILTTPTDAFRCHFRGRTEICNAGICHKGSAALSNCGRSGINGYMKIDGDDVHLRPLPPSVSQHVQEAHGGHLASKLLPLEYWDDLQELSLDYEPDSIAARFGSSYFAQKIRETYGFVGGNDLAMPYALPIDEDITNSVDTRLVLDVAVFVDQNMATQLEKEYETAEDQVNAVLSALNAVQVIFDDDSFGDQKLRIRVKRVIIDQTGKVFKGDGEAKAYLLDLCDYQEQLIKTIGKFDWDVTLALTGLDVFGVLNDVLSDDAYSGIKFPGQRVYGVTGLTFTGGACRSHRNCVLVEFWRGMENVDTIAHEIGHSIGMNHDGSGNKCGSHSGNIMSLSSAKQRIGWSTCSVKSFHDFLSTGKASCLKTERDNGEPRSAAVTNG